MTFALRTEGLAKSFPVGERLFGAPRAHVHAVQPVTLEVKSGETLGIVGESGCGKSTLARMLVGLLKPSAGRIEIEGRPQEEPGPAEFGRMIQYVFQDPISSLNPRMTIRQSMEVPLKRLQGLGPNECQTRIEEIFAAVNLRKDFLGRFPHEFSGGQAQRIGIARALAAEPRILVLDEPVSALDVSVQAQVLNLLADLKRRLGLTYLFISHDLAVVEAVSDRVAVMYFGSVVEIGPASGIFSVPVHPYTRLLARSAPSVGRPMEAPEATETELPDPLDPPKGCAFAARCPRASDLCRQITPQLEEKSDGHRTACHHPHSA